MADASIEALTAQAEAEWLERWSTGPSDATLALPDVGHEAPDLKLVDDTGAQRRLSECWAESPALIMFWRHFGCNCGVMRAERLRAELPALLDAGIRPVIVGQGEPLRAQAYKAAQQLPVTILCDPDHVAYRAYGIGHWDYPAVMFSEPSEDYLADPRAVGVRIQQERREQGGQALVDDPWRAAAEFIVGTDGVVRLAHRYEHCFDFPDPAVLLAASR